MNIYNQNYFDETIFDTDYETIASEINRKYSPKKIIEFGCGPGHLTLALAKLGINITAVDGFSNPNFSNVKNISFTKLDLNNKKDSKAFLNSNTEFDLAICMEVAEHLSPKSCSHLINLLTRSAPVVIFSAAVPNQLGAGHINCQNRLLWHKLFSKNNFVLIDSLRKEFTSNDKLAIWYKLNTLDYVNQNHVEVDLSLLNRTIENLMHNESYASSLFYDTSNALNSKVAYLNYFGIKQYMMLRNFLKRFKNG